MMIRVRRVMVTMLVVCCGVVGIAHAADADGGDPVGAFDTISVRLSHHTTGIPTVHDWMVFGWAADPDASGQPTDVHLYLDGQLYQVVQTSDSRPDVPNVFPFAGSNSGWHSSIAVYDDAAHTICAYAINVGDGSQNTTLGCRTFPIGGTSIADPQGNLEAITAAPGLVRLQGWVGDGDNAGPTPVRLVEDGSIWEPLMPQLDRPDVRAAFPGMHNGAGFDETLPIVPGQHIVCLDAGNDGPNGINNTSLGCRLIDVPDMTPPSGTEARGSFEQLSSSDYPHYVATGWAWNPAGAGPSTVRVRQVKIGQLHFAEASTTEVVANEARPDVQQANPGAPRDTGFHADLYGGNPLEIITYACGYILDGSTERFIGCRHP